MCVISCVMPEERENNPMIYTVTMNPSLDYFVKMKNFEFGKQIERNMRTCSRVAKVSMFPSC